MINFAFDLFISFEPTTFQMLDRIPVLICGLSTVQQLCKVS